VNGLFLLLGGISGGGGNVGHWLLGAYIRTNPTVGIVEIYDFYLKYLGWSKFYWGCPDTPNKIYSIS
jgi:hypothetical protein